MIDLSLTQEQAVAILLLINREQGIYSQDPAVCPSRVLELRNVMFEIDAKLDEVVTQEEE